MNESKNHHFVPQWYLRRFAMDATQKQIAVFDKLNSKKFPASIESTGSEKYFNTVKIEGHSLNLESLFDKVDADAPQAIKVVLDQRSVAGLTRDQREVIAIAAMVQLHRTKMPRTSMIQFHKQLKSSLPANVDLSKLEINEEQAKLFSLMSVVQSSDLVPEILNKDWVLMETTPDVPFWISDNPVVMENLFPYAEVGLKVPGIQVHWPISSKMLLSFYYPQIKNRARYVQPSAVAQIIGGKALAAKPEEVIYYNSLQVLNSSRFIYSSKLDFSLAEQVLDKAPQAKLIESKMKVLPLGQGPSNKNIREGTWLIVYGANQSYAMQVEQWFCSIAGEKFVIHVKKDFINILAHAVFDKPCTQIVIFEKQSETCRMRELDLIADKNDQSKVTLLSKIQLQAK